MVIVRCKSLRSDLFFHRDKFTNTTMSDSCSRFGKLSRRAHDDFVSRDGAVQERTHGCVDQGPKMTTFGCWRVRLSRQDFAATLSAWAALLSLMKPKPAPGLTIG
jgi:hypothetical protein